MQAHVGGAPAASTHCAAHSPAAPLRVRSRSRHARGRSLMDVAAARWSYPSTATVWVLAAHGWVGPLSKGTEEWRSEMRAAGVEADASRKLAETHLTDVHHAKRARTRE